MDANNEVVKNSRAVTRAAFRRRRDRVGDLLQKILESLHELDVDPEDYAKAEKVAKAADELLTIKIPLKHRFGDRSCIPESRPYPENRKKRSSTKSFLNGDSVPDISTLTI